MKGLRISKADKSSLLDYNDYVLQPVEYLRLFMTTLLMDALVAYTFYQSRRLFLAAVPACLLYPFLQRPALCAKRRQELLLQFKEALSVLSSFLSAGYSTENAFRASVPELRHLFSPDAMIVREFEQIVHGMSLHKPVELLLSDFAYRSGLEDAANFAEVFSVAKKKGGHLVKIISHTASVIRDKIQLSEDILTMNAARRYEQRIMNLVPFLIIVYMNFTSPDFFRTLYTTLLGRITMTFCLLVYLCSVWLAGRIMNIEV